MAEAWLSTTSQLNASGHAQDHIVTGQVALTTTSTLQPYGRAFNQPAALRRMMSRLNVTGRCAPVGSMPFTTVSWLSAHGWVLVTPALAFHTTSGLTATGTNVMCGQVQ